MHPDENCLCKGVCLHSILSSGMLYKNDTYSEVNGWTGKFFDSSGPAIPFQASFELWDSQLQSPFVNMSLSSATLPGEWVLCRRWGCCLGSEQIRVCTYPNSYNLPSLRKNKSLGICIFEDSFSQMSEIWETSPTRSTPNNAYQISGQTEFKPLKSKNALQSLTGKAATTGSDMLGKLNMSISHCYEKNDIISTWHFSLIFVLDAYWSSVLPSWYFWHRILLCLFFFLIWRKCQIV